jgi:hypothetical protein
MLTVELPRVDRCDHRPEEETPQALDRCDNRPKEAVTDETDETGQTDEGRDAFDSQSQRFYCPALEASNAMQLPKHAWFRAECDHTLRTRLPLH